MFYTNIHTDHLQLIVGLYEVGSMCTDFQVDLSIPFRKKNCAMVCQNNSLHKTFLTFVHTHNCESNVLFYKRDYRKIVLYILVTPNDVLAHQGFTPNLATHPHPFLGENKSQPPYTLM